VEPIRPIGPRPDLAPVRPVVLSPREREERKRERDERRRGGGDRRGENEERGRDDGAPPRLDVRA
jgi:hypothetical protein